ASHVTVVDGTAAVETAHRIAATRPDGELLRLAADASIIATGAHPRVIPGAQPDGERILTWKQVYGLSTSPEHLIVVGSGVTGAEFAGAYNALGCPVTLVSSRDRVLPGADVGSADLLEDGARLG